MTKGASDDRLFKHSQLYAEGKLRPVFRGMLHGLGCLLVPLLLLRLLASAPSWCADNVLVWLPVLVFALGHVACWGTSYCYHRLSHSPATEVFLQKLDHSMVFVMIYSCWTPLAVFTLELERVWALQAVLLLGLVAGFVVVFVWRISKPVMHVGYGALAAYELGTITSRITSTEALFFAASAATHVLAACQFASRWPLTTHRVFSFHEIFHTLNVLAALLFFCLLQSIVARGGSAEFGQCHMVA
jgi:hemolysin III